MKDKKPKTQQEFNSMVDDMAKNMPMSELEPVVEFSDNVRSAAYQAQQLENSKLISVGQVTIQDKRQSQYSKKNK